jgi:hypothetical protein
MINLEVLIYDYFEQENFETEGLIQFLRAGAK